VSKAGPLLKKRPRQHEPQQHHRLVEKQGKPAHAKKATSWPVALPIPRRPPGCPCSEPMAACGRAHQGSGAPARAGRCVSTKGVEPKATKRATGQRASQGEMAQHREQQHARRTINCRHPAHQRDGPPPTSALCATSGLAAGGLKPSERRLADQRPSTAIPRPASAQGVASGPTQARASEQWALAWRTPCCYSSLARPHAHSATHPPTSRSSGASCPASISRIRRHGFRRHRYCVPPIRDPGPGADEREQGHIQAGTQLGVGTAATTAAGKSEMREGKCSLARRARAANATTTSS